ncbi:NS5 [Bluetongue virus 8]|uniref:NS5 n=2 Tax=Bluetongue virus TaxID=40051 RepID=A0A6N0UNN2_BTV|nr:NS5 [Bluetongue virus 8]QKR71831.1 NS5 [Bluetongue virus]QKR71844.1 NS5 [Bluetongue virus]QKR71857.1 NS5 [Bluetongue virus]QKR71870.1 NS5 [Bluetongue virus]
MTPSLNHQGMLRVHQCHHLCQRLPLKYWTKRCQTQLVQRKHKRRRRLHSHRTRKRFVMM